MTRDDDARPDGPHVDLSITIEARPDTIFSLLSERDGLVKLLGASVDGEPEPGASLRLGFQGCSTIVRADVLELVPPTRVVWGWGVAEGPQAETIPPGSTRVTITLEEVENGTLVRLVHSGLPDEREAHEHEAGWRAYLAQLDTLATGHEATPRAERAAETFLAAWNEDDDDARGALIAQALTDDARFVDPFANVTGHDAFGAHVAGARRAVPGSRLERSGSVQVVAGRHVRFAWSATDGEGRPIARGTNVARLAKDGRLEEVIGFWDES